MGTVYHDYDENTWEWAVSRIIVHHELEMHNGQRAVYKDLFRQGMYPTLARTAWAEVLDSGVEWTGPDMIALLSGKQHDYGHANIMEFGQQGVLVRLWDKIARYENLMRRGVDPENETLVDTLLDMIGYCIIYLMLKNNTFTLPLAGDR
jgi:hypothetical protein